MALLSSIAVCGEPFDPKETLADILGPDPWNPLCEAVRQGDKDRVRDLSFQLSSATTAAISPKKEAIVVGRPDFLRLLLEQNSTITEELVAAACNRKDTECVQVLLEFGWPIDQPIYSTASLLSFAVHDVEFMKWLIEMGADIDATSNLDETALAIAIAHCNMEVVTLLLSKGADITRGNLLHCAAERRDQYEGAKLATYLAQHGADVNAHRHNNPVARRLRGTKQLLTPLHVACMEQNLPVAQALLQSGADPRMEVLEAGQRAPPTVLDQAHMLGSREMIDLLLGYEMIVCSNL
ncbi:hypothetical protein LTR37_019426 [Vermiconidia calcicola]|uniref:Uncharacterized protein n=1 Tax=Vermiconidia calcicola TaxID=1690605 RepID=A0ACC3ME35_9PEZI|nr:hypothetical protein LTR37_019426 [Vermiconidia calcicola]